MLGKNSEEFSAFIPTSDGAVVVLMGAEGGGRGYFLEHLGKGRLEFSRKVLSEVKGMPERYKPDN